LGFAELEGGRRREGGRGFLEQAITLVVNWVGKGGVEVVMTKIYIGKWVDDDLNLFTWKKKKKKKQSGKEPP